MAPFANGMQSRYPSSLEQGIREIVRRDEENDSASQSVVERRAISPPRDGYRIAVRAEAS